MPKELFERDGSESSVKRWADHVADALAMSDEVMAAIGGVDAKAPCAPRQLALRAARMVQLLLRCREVRRLCIEGGATASSVVRQLNWNRMKVCRSFGPGNVALRHEAKRAPDFIVKPGSYPWPNELWPLDEST
jgi:uncharacterized protein YgbK (DUF1537 family)